MNCQQCQDLIADYLGGELPEDLATAFAAHLSRCPDCGRRVGELAECVSVLERLEETPVEVAHDRTRNLRVVRRRSLAARTALTLLKTAAVLALGVFVGRYTAAEPESHTERHSETRFVATDVHPGWLKLARDARSGPSTLAGQLAILAESRR